MAAEFERLPAWEAYRIITREILADLKAFMLRRVRRGKERVRAEYDAGEWKAILREKRWLKCTSVRDYVAFNDGKLRVAKIHNQLVRVRTDAYYAYRLQILQEVMKEWAGDAVELCELGCGWGLNLFSLSLANRWKRLAGFDISENALQAAREAAEHFGLDNMRFGSLDLTDPRDSGFEELRGKPVFTYHCLEQLKYSTAAIVDNLRRAGVWRVIHFEPTTELLRIWFPMDLANLLYIARQDYQDNLLRTLWAFERRGLIKVLEQKRLYYAPTHRHDNVLVCWEPVA